jgi:GntR family negative regulator for fad regulon and positive regulator of fabA
MVAVHKLERPIEFAEKMLIQGILDGAFPIGERLPPERDLAGQIGITRPTLREAIRHLEQEGWVLVRQGKPTIVRDFWREGGLNILNRLIHYQGYIQANFITHLLEFRLLLAPSYTRDAVRRDAQMVRDWLAQKPAREADAASFAAFDWQLQRTLTIASGNVIFPLMLNGFEHFYERIARRYFQPVEARLTSHDYYEALEKAALLPDGEAAFQLTQTVMEASVRHWRITTAGIDRIELE